MAACSFSAEAERHSLKRSSSVTTDWMSNAFALRFRPLAETKVRLIFIIKPCQMSMALTQKDNYNQ